MQADGPALRNGAAGDGPSESQMGVWQLGAYQMGDLTFKRAWPLYLAAFILGCMLGW